MTGTSHKITAYWLKHYVSGPGFCSLCGNRGVIDTRGVTTHAGVMVGGLNYCICPNGQVMREGGVDKEQAVMEGLLNE